VAEFISSFRSELPQQLNTNTCIKVSLASFRAKMTQALNCVSSEVFVERSCCDWINTRLPNTHGTGATCLLMIAVFPLPRNFHKERLKKRLSVNETASMV
jgi:hypothetical protein